MTIIPGKGDSLPLILHLPHSGTRIPAEMGNRMEPAMLSSLDDTDWYLENLYDFATDLGITIIKANYHRWVADLNRDPFGKALYNDGRVITGVVPSTDFNGNSIYLEGQQPLESEIPERINEFHSPYFTELRRILKEFKNKHGRLLIWDGHSIRRNVPGIRKEPFPDLILGTNDGRSAKSELIKSCRRLMESSGFRVSFDHPFKGGFITRSLGNPDGNTHALQMEMSKDLYMSDGETKYDESRASRVRDLFRRIMETIVDIL